MYATGSASSAKTKSKSIAVVTKRCPEWYLFLSNLLKETMPYSDVMIRI